MRRFLIIARSCLALSLTASAAESADWPQFQGPNQSGISSETNLARAWPSNGPPTLWTIELGVGFAGAAVRDGEVFVLDRIAPARPGPGAVPSADTNAPRDVLRCLDLQTGTEKWSFAYDAPVPRPRQLRGSVNVPTVDAELVFTLGPGGHFHALSRKTHEPLWSTNTVAGFPGRTALTSFATPDEVEGIWRTTLLRRDPAVPQWGVTQCPLLYKDTVIVAPMTELVALAAYEKATGKIRWKTPGCLGRNWFCHVTPYLTALCGRDQVILIGNRHFGKDPAAVISGVDAATGALLWRIDTWKRYNVPIPMPVKIAEDSLFFSGGYEIGCFILKLREDAGNWTAEFTMKENMNCTAHIQKPLFFNGHIYAQSFDRYHNKTSNGLVCLDGLGNTMWQTGPDRVFDNGNIIIADGLLFIMDGADGTLHVAEASPEGYKELASAKVLKGEKREVWAPMALSDGRLIIRDMTRMKCLNVRAPSR